MRSMKYIKERKKRALFYQSTINLVFRPDKAKNTKSYRNRAQNKVQKYTKHDYVNFVLECIID